MIRCSGVGYSFPIFIDIGDTEVTPAVINVPEEVAQSLFSQKSLLKETEDDHVNQSLLVYALAFLDVASGSIVGGFWQQSTSTIT